MKTTRFSFMAMVAGSCLAVAGCGTAAELADDSSVDAYVQRIDFDLTSLDGASVESLSYTLTNTTSGTVKTGTVDVSADATLELSLLLRPGNYSIAFSGTGTFEGEDVPCAGSTDFTVVVGSNPAVQVDVVCEATDGIEITPTETGDVKVSANLTVEREVIEGECGFTYAFIGPLTAVAGKPIVTEVEYVTVGSPAATVAWTASGLTGEFADAEDPTTTFSCLVPGTGTITATLGGGVSGCTDVVTADVTCVVDTTIEPEFTLQLLHASDQEAGLAAISDAPRFSAVMAALTARYPAHTLKIANGDVWLPGVFFNAGGDPALSAVPAVGAASIGRADIAIANLVGFDAAAFGNHEFDSGPREIRNILLAAGAWSGTRFPYLSSNLNFAPSSDLASLVIPNETEVDLHNPGTTLRNKISGSVIFQVNGDYVGVIGATTPTLPSISSPAPVVTLPSVQDDYDALAAILQTRVDAIRARGVDKIIVAAHMQQYDIELNQLAHRLDGVDVIIAGGNHSVWADSNDVLYPPDTPVREYPEWRSSSSGEPLAVVNVGSNYRYVGSLVAHFDALGRLIPSAHDANESGAYATDAAGVERLEAGALVDPEVAAVTNAIGSVIASKDGSIFGKTQVYLNGLRISVRTEETNLGNLTADANLWLAQQSDPTTLVSIKNGGGIRDSIGTVGAGATPTFNPPAANPEAGKLEGEVSQLDIENSLRFNNDLALVTVTAAQLKEILEHGVAGVAPGATPGQFAQVGGLRFAYNPSLPAQSLAPSTFVVLTPGQRVQSVELVDAAGNAIDIVVQGGVVQGDPNRAIRLVTLSFLADGGDNYPFPRYAVENAFYTRVNLDATSGNQGFNDLGREQYALAQYLLSVFPTTGPGFSVADSPVGSDSRIVRQ